MATELKNVGGTIVCITSVALSCGYRLILTVDLCGYLLVYGWLENTVTLSLFFSFAVSFVLLVFLKLLHSFQPTWIQKCNA